MADPGKYGLYDCKQLEAARKSLAAQAAELEGSLPRQKLALAGPW